MNKRTEPYKDLHVQVPEAVYEDFVSLHPAYGERTKIIGKLLKHYVAHKRAQQANRNAA